MSKVNELRKLLDTEGIQSIQAAMRHKDLAKLGDPLTNLLFSLAYSLHSTKFIGKKVSGKILAAALRLANLRHLAPSRLDAHGLGDCVEAMIAYAWLREIFTITKAVNLLQVQFRQENPETQPTKAKREEAMAKVFSALLTSIWEKISKEKTV